MEEFSSAVREAYSSWHNGNQAWPSTPQCRDVWGVLGNLECCPMMTRGASLSASLLEELRRGVFRRAANSAAIRRSRICRLSAPERLLSALDAQQCDAEGFQGRYNAEGFQGRPNCPTLCRERCGKKKQKVAWNPSLIIPSQDWKNCRDLTPNSAPRHHGPTKPPVHRSTIELRS